MRKSSWILLLIGLFLVFSLVTYYQATRPGPIDWTPEMSQAMLAKMEAAVAAKSVDGLMSYVSSGPDVRVVGMRPDQGRMLLVRAFRDSSRLEMKADNVTTVRDGEAAVVEFDLKVLHRESGYTSEDYSGHITLQMRRQDTPRLLGLAKVKDWRIVGAETTGRDPSQFGE